VKLSPVLWEIQRVVNLRGTREIKGETVISVMKRQDLVGEMEEIDCVLVCRSYDGREELRETIIVGAATEIKLRGVIRVAYIQRFVEARTNQIV
jgi:hypothetical protein